MPTMTVEEMDAQHAKLAAVEKAVTLEGEEALENEEFSGLDLYTTLLEALDLLKRTAVFYDYASDKVLMPSITNSHRSLMNRMSNTIHNFTEAIESNLLEAEETE
jgi:hypothetical protein